MRLREVKRSMAQLVRYTALGLAANLAGYILYLVLTTLIQLSPLAAITIVFSSVSTANFLGNKVWTFDDQDPVRKTAPKYLAAQALGYFTNLGFMQIFHTILSFPHAFVQLLSLVFVAVELFLLSKFFVFRASG